MDLKRLAIVALGALLLSRDAGVGGQPAGPPPDPAAIVRGMLLYEVTFNCAACHGRSGRGGPNNAPDLTASAMAIQPDGGRGLAAFLQVGRPERGMPPVPVPLTESQAADLSATLRSFAVAAGPLLPSDRRGAEGAGGRGDATALPPALAGQELSILVGDPALGRRFFSGPVGKCSSCHSVVDRQTSSAANLARIATKYPDAKALQNAMLLNRGLYWSPRTSKDVRATITYANGRTLRGYLTSVSDFKVVIRDETGRETEAARHDGEPKVTLSDRLQHHLDLLERYHDNDIHNLTAYLSTLR
jgi:cytochrome c oxidase cbb3-type subunit III